MTKIIIVTLIALASVATSQLFFTNTASAINAADFEPGRIIDDALFYDKGGMSSVAEVQSFLNAHVPSCDTQGTRPSGYGNLTNAQYAQQVKGWPGPPYVCLNNYYENPSTGQTSYEMGGGAFAGGQSAAQIIYDAAQQYSINPKVLLVLLRKESLNLFSDSWPMKSQYKYAMGYACPDSGPNYSAACVDSKSGFYKQVSLAAWQLRYYYNNMGTYNYTPGRWNTIQYSTNPACGTKDVYIQNYATASLYIYTPYTPNDAALNAYPGTAPCGAYGNRNFWFFWQEWFGTTKINGNFLRSTTDATVYLIGKDKKYPISDPSLMTAASRLGNVGFVSQSYLDSIPSGQLLGRFIQSPGGTIYYYDSNIKLSFSSCGLVADYGGSCGGAVELTQAQIDSFANGPTMTRGMNTISGKSYYIANGVRREILDSQSLTQAGISVGFNTLTDSSIAKLAPGVPIVRDSVIIKNRQDTTKQYVNYANRSYALDVRIANNVAFSALPTGLLDGTSISQLPVPDATVSDVIKNEIGTTYIFTQDGKRQVQDPASLNPLVVPTVGTGLVNQLLGTGTLSNPALVKSYDDSTVYVIVAGQKRPLIAMEDLKSITGQDSPYIAWVNGNTLSALPTGNIIAGAGRLVKTPTNATVYMTDGYDKLIPMSSFNPAIDLGVKAGIKTISDSILSKYTVTNYTLSSYIDCGGVKYVAMAGVLYQHTIGTNTSRQLEPQTCNVLAVSSQTPKFLNSPGGTIYELSSGVLHPITSWQSYLARSAGGGSLARVTDSTIGLFPIGSAY